MQAEKAKPKPSKAATAAKLGDETFMSATELRQLHDRSRDGQGFEGCRTRWIVPNRREPSS